MEHAWKVFSALFEKGHPLNQYYASPPREPLATGPPPLEPSQRLKAQPYYPKPSMENMRVWFGQPIESPFALAFHGIEPAAVEIMLARLQFPGSFERRVRSALAGIPNAAQEERALSEGFGEEIKAFYGMRREEYEGILREFFTSIPELFAVYRQRGVGALGLRVILNHATRRNGRYAIEHNHDTWRALLESQRAAVASKVDTSETASAKGENLALRVEAADDPAAIARKYAAGRDPLTVERLLREKLKGKSSIVLPLESLLPEFIRRNLNRFENCTGPNCTSAALSLHDDYKYRNRYDSGVYGAAFVGAHYTEVKDGGLKVGDVLFYWDLDGHHVHTAAYVGDGYVFTKNGLSRYAPYLFQTKADMERWYFPKGESEFELLVFRPNPWYGFIKSN